MSKTIEIDVQYSENDFIRGMTYSQLRDKSKILNSIIYFVSTLVGYFIVYLFLIRSGGPWNWDDALSLGLGAMIAIPVAYVLGEFIFSGDRAFSNEYRSSSLLREPYKIVFTDSGIVSTSDSFESEIKWNALTEIRETAHDFFFFTSPHVAMFVPIRVFTTQQQSDLRNLTREMLDAEYQSLAISP